MALLTELVQTAVARLPAGRGLRLLKIGAEVGGAVGSVAGSLLPLLPPARVEYVLAASRSEALQSIPAALAQHPAVRCQVWDMAQPPLAQGSAPGQADLVIATDAANSLED